jgi:SlyX protein
MNENRLLELEIKSAYQDDLLLALNDRVAKQQQQITDLETACKLLHQRISSLAQDQGMDIIDQAPPHY